MSYTPGTPEYYTDQILKLEDEIKLVSDLRRQDIESLHKSEAKAEEWYRLSVAKDRHNARLREALERISNGIANPCKYAFDVLESLKSGEATNED